MSDPGLTNRLRQRSRRAGIAVGLSMALTIALCIGSFAWIYAQTDPLLSDLVGARSTLPPEREPTATEEADEAAQGSGGEAEEDPDPEPTATDEPEPTSTPRPTPTPDVFQTTHISNPDLRVNLRPEPSVDNEPVAILDAGTPLQAIGEEETDAEGNLWLRFRTEDDQEGWLREGTFQAI